MFYYITFEGEKYYPENNEVKLTGLDYDATYHYTAFITTSTGETFYGEEQMFSIGRAQRGHMIL